MIAACLPVILFVIATFVAVIAAAVGAILGGILEFTIALCRRRAVPPANDLNRNDQTHNA